MGIRLATIEWSGGTLEASPMSGGVISSTFEPRIIQFGLKRRHDSWAQMVIFDRRRC
jgi:hypothetical protein